jgi:hypothetical protein
LNWRTLGKTRASKENSVVETLLLLLYLKRHKQKASNIKDFRAVCLFELARAFGKQNEKTKN